MFKTAIFLSVLFTVTFKVNSLECYSCYDCANSDWELASCDTLLPSSSTTSTSTTPTSTTSLTTPSTSTETSTSTTTTSTESTTISTTTTTSTESTTTSTTTPTTNTSIESTTTTTTTETPSVGNAERADISFECFSGIVRVNNTDIIVRGCTAGRTNETCETFGMTSCTFCSTDKCNAAGSIQSSVAVLLFVLIFTYVLKN